MDGKWTFNDREDGLWNDGGGVYSDSPEDAFRDGCDYGYEPGQAVYVGRVRQLTWYNIVSCLDILARLDEQVSDAVGEAGDDIFSSLTNNDKQQLETMIAAAVSSWAEQHKIRLPFAVDDVHFGGFVPEDGAVAAYEGRKS